MFMCLSSWDWTVCFDRCTFTYVSFISLSPSLSPPPPRWIEACIEDELPPTTELEQALRNGVILCRLGHYYAPDIIPLRRIYDLDEAKYRVRESHSLRCKIYIFIIPLWCFFVVWPAI